MIFRASRKNPGDDRWLNLKVAIFCLGAGTALVGMATETGWIVTVATVILLIGFLMRFLPAGKDDQPEV